MRLCAVIVFILATLGPVKAQSWELGGGGGAGFSRQLAVSNAAGQANAGFANGPAFGGFIGQELSRSVSGEIRYTLRPAQMKLSKGGEQATFQGRSHAIHYDLVFYAKPAGAAVRPFLAAGGGVRVFQGAGRETEYQTLQDYALLTKTTEWKPLVSMGGGVKIRLAPNLYLTTELRDYLTPFPKKVITPNSGSSLGGWLNEVVPLVCVSYVF